MGLALALGLGIAGPPLAHWWEARRAARPSTDGGSPASVQAGLPQPTLPEPTLPRSVQPIATPAGNYADAGAANEAYALYQRGDIVAACER